jgi:LuxR family maltose regulon positive regulatory protein
MMKLPVSVALAAADTGPSLSHRVVQSAKRDMSPEAMAGIETAVEAARRYIIKRPRLTRLLDNANARVLMLVAPAGFGKTTLAREWVADRPHVWYRGTTATADVAALIAGLSTAISEALPEAGARAVARMRATGTPEQDVDILADLFAEDLAAWPEDLWLVVDDYQFAMEAKAPERFVDGLLRRSPVKLLLTSRKRPKWASARRLLYGEIYELGRNELAMDHDEAAAVLAHRKDAPAAGLVALAEGWPAVIGLAALTDELDLPEGSLPDTLYEYLADELYQAAAPEVQRHLCRLAVAPSLADGVAEFMLGSATGVILKEGMRLGFLSARAHGLEIHPLLRTFLRRKAAELGTEYEAEAEGLAHFLIKRRAWDEALLVIELLASDELFVDLMEQGLPLMLAEARMPTISQWLDYATARRVDAPIVDLTEAEVAFLRGQRRKSESLALRAARRFEPSNPLVSRAYYIAGTSARMDYHHDDAQLHFADALATGQTTADRREASFGAFIASLDAGTADSSNHLNRLLELDDGSATSEVRITLARFISGIREGSVDGLLNLFATTEHLLSRLSDPHLLSSFYVSHGVLYALDGQYARASAVAALARRYATEVRLPFVLPHAKRVTAISELGLRHFARCARVLGSIEREAMKSADIFAECEAMLIRSRLLISQGLPDRAVTILRQPPERFPFDGERGEYLATLALALACSGKLDEADRAASEAEDFATTVEVRSLSGCTRAILGIAQAAPAAVDVAQTALGIVLDSGGVDSFVCAYRGYPELLRALVHNPELRHHLHSILLRAKDEALATSSGLDKTIRRAPSVLSPREREVLELLAEGLTNKEIARTLFISEATAKIHVRHILQKLRVRTRTEAALRLAEVVESD